MRGRTTIVIAHRPATIALADRALERALRSDRLWASERRAAAGGRRVPERTLPW